MRVRTRWLGVALLVLLGAVALYWTRRTDSSPASMPRGSERVTQAPSPGGPAGLEALDDAAGRAPVSPADGNLAAQGASATAAPDGMLFVSVVAKETGLPANGINVMMLARDLSQGLPAALAESPHGEFGVAPRTGDDGRVDFKVPAGLDLVLSIPASGHSHGDAELDVPALAPDERREVMLEILTRDDIAFWGQLVDASDGHPIVDGEVRMTRGYDHAGTPGPEVRVRSGPDGRFQLRTASWRTDTADVSAAGYGPLAFRPGEGHDSASLALEIALERAASLSVHVVDRANAPQLGVEVRLVANAAHLFQQNGVWDPSGSDESEWSAVTDADGRCTLTGLAPNVSLAVHVRSEGFPLQSPIEPLQLAPGEARTVELVLREASSVAGRIIDQHGDPVAECRLWRIEAPHRVPHLFSEYEVSFAESSSAATTVTDETGRFVFEGVAAGAWWIGPAAEREEDFRPGDPARIAPLAEVIDVEAGVSIAELVLHVDRGLYISGRVVGLEGAPIDRCGACASRQGDYEAWCSTECAPDGAFVLGPLPHGRWTVFVLSEANAYSETEPQDIAAGQSGVLFELRRGATLRGRFAGLGDLEPECELLLCHADPGIYSHGSSATRSNSFEFEGLPPGVYHLIARSRQGAFGMLTNITVAEGDSIDDLVLRLVPGAKLRIRAEGVDADSVVEIISDGRRISFRWFDEGPEQVVTVPAGELRVDLRNADDQERDAPPIATSTLRVAVGEEREVVLRRER